MTADCDGFALVCCVLKDMRGWVVKRSKTGAGFAPSSFTADDTRFWLSSASAIKEYNAEGKCLWTFPGQRYASYMECSGNTLYFVGYHSGILYAVDTISTASKLLTTDVKATGGLALFPAAKKLLFISSRNSLCQLDMQSGECRVITPSVWPGGGRLLTVNDKRALYIVPSTGGSNFFSCSVQGKVCNLRSVRHSAISADYRLNSRGDLLFIDQRDRNMPCISCLPALLPPPEASACKTPSPKGGQ
ncbi:hypothetical protein V8C86DRAFT_2572974 [Haematococcus lacustris]